MEKEFHRPTSRVLDILELLAANPQGMTMTEIADAIAAPKSSIFPILHTMAARKFISVRQSDSKYYLGISAFCFGAAYAANTDALSVIESEMKRLVETTGEICQLGILDGADVLYIAKIDSKEAIRLESHVGKRIPAYSTALGKALLSGISMDTIKKLYPDGLKPMTSHTITSFSNLEQQLQNIRQTGIAREKEEITLHIQCAAVPLCVKGTVISAMSISVPIFRATKEKLLLAEKELLDSKKQIETYFQTADISADAWIK